MANALYDFGRESFLAGDIAWDTDTIKVTLADGADYTPNTGTDDYYDDVTGAGRVATSGALSSKSITAGTADAADVTLSSVSGDQSEYLVIWKDTTVEGTSILIALIDSATGLPVTPNGGDVVIQWDAGSNKIFRL